MPECKACGAQLVWGKDVVTGSLHPLEAPALEPKPGRIAYDPRTQRAQVMREETMDRVDEYVAKGATFHESHFGSCPNARSFRGVNPHQASLW